MNIGIVGMGRVGSVMKQALAAQGHAISWGWTRHQGVSLTQEPEVELVLVCVVDHAIEEIGHQLRLRPSAAREVWLHTSGSQPGTLLRKQDTVPKSVGALHPLCALNDTSTPKSLKGCVAGIDGEPSANQIAHDLAQGMGMLPMPLNTQTKPLYHAAAVTVAGHATALFQQAVTMLSACGVDAATAQRALLPLMERAVMNLQHGSPVNVITGPIPRGDLATVASHLQHVSTLDPTLLQTYVNLARTSMTVLEHRLDDATENRLIDIFNNHDPSGKQE